MKAIVSTSANPLHYGHLDIYKKAKEIFQDVKIVIAQNSDKSKPNNLKFHLNAYGIPYEIIENETVADYCKKNDITHIVRGIRNGVDAEYELKMDFANKEINPDIQTIFIPTNDIYSNISSSTIREFLKYRKYDIVKKYMNEEAMWRYVNGVDYICCFGKSCIGKSTLLQNKEARENLFGDSSIEIVNIDKHFWEVCNSVYGDSETNKLMLESKKIVYDSKKSARTKNDELLSNEHFNDVFWDKFFEGLSGKVLDWASVGFYYDIIPLRYRSKMFFTEFILDEHNRSFFSESKGFKEKILYLDELYTLPKIIDTTVDISKFKSVVIY